MSETLGLYLSIPFCRSKCTFCNFASDVFHPRQMPAYVERLCAEIKGARARAEQMGALLPEEVNTVYLGGGTPSLLAPQEIAHLFAVLRGEFHLDASAEVTAECAPGQLAPETLEAFQLQGLNRISFGVQSFVDAEAAAVGRRHTGALCRGEIDRVRAAGVTNVAVDLIAGLPGQTQDSWRYSLDQVLASDVGHASVYLLEIDEDSRLGREVLSAGDRFGAQSVPDENLVTEMYIDGCEKFGRGGLAQYEISNFARAGWVSRHNVKYWQRAPYLGFGLDAHSMLRASAGGELRFANTEDLLAYLAPSFAGAPESSGLGLLGAGTASAGRRVGRDEATEEILFLGLRMNAGVSLGELACAASKAALEVLVPVLEDACAEGLLCRDADRFRLTTRGRLLSNELFSRLLLLAEPA